MGRRRLNLSCSRETMLELDRLRDVVARRRYRNPGDVTYAEIVAWAVREAVDRNAPAEAPSSSSTAAGKSKAHSPSSGGYAHA
jgi:hypothetical protein